MIIRQETKQDFAVLRSFVTTAFLTAKVASGGEAAFMDSLRAEGFYIPELALVAEDGGKIVGQVMLTHAHVGASDILLLGPVAVFLPLRNRGIGSLLIRTALQKAKAMGHKAVCLVGDPAYYRRFGFKQASLYGMGYKGIPDQFVLALELVPAGLKGMKGNIVHVC